MTSALSPAPNVASRATLTADQSGTIISCNTAVKSMFGYDSDELLDKSCRVMIQMLPRRKKPQSLAASTSSERFSKSEMWLCILSELTMARVVNAKHQDGTLVPVTLTSTTINAGGLQLYVLMFEFLPKGSVILTCDGDLVVQSCTTNIQDLLRVPPRDICGKTLQRFVSGQPCWLQNSLDAGRAARFGKDAKHATGSPVDIYAVPREIGGPGIPMTLQVLSAHDELYVVSLKSCEGGRRAPAPAESGASAIAAAVDMNAKGGVKQDKALVEEEIGCYTVTAALGMGQCGIVRRGVHRTTGTQVAVKTLTRESFAELGLSFPGKEVDLMKYLHHPNIVQLYDYISSADRLYLIMELVSGGELLSYCFDSGPLPEVELRKYFRDILAAVDYLHRKGVVHRDLKLENCLIEDQFNQKRIKLIDFGLATFYLSGALKTSCGSADYAAPELFTSTLYYGPPVDVWALGVLTYAAVCGRFPFENVRATMDGEYVWPEKPQVSNGLKNLLGMMFETNPDLRLTVEQIRRHEWVNTGYRGPPDRPAILTSTTGVTTSVRRDVLTPRADILLQMEEMYGLTMEASLQSVLTEQANLLTATYKMLLTRHPKMLPFDPSSSDPMASTFADPAKVAPVEAMVKETERRVERGVLMDLVLMRSLARERMPPRTGRIDLGPEVAAPVFSGHTRQLSLSAERATETRADKPRVPRPGSVLIPSTVKTVAPVRSGGAGSGETAAVPVIRNLQEAVARRTSPTFATRERSNSKSANSTPRETLEVDTGAVTAGPRSGRSDEYLGSKQNNTVVTGAAQQLLRQARERSASRDEGQGVPPALPVSATIRMGARRNSNATTRK
jgi:PAS domain S-box-containing protein